MKQYTFTVAPVIAAMLPGYDCNKIGNAVESHGNASLKLVETNARSLNRYTPEKATSKTVKDAKSNATATTTLKFEGDGSAPRMFAGWHDDTVKMVVKYGNLVACPLPVSLKTWLDAKFKASGKAKASNNGIAHKPRNVSPVPASNGATVAPATVG